ncbi:MAG: aminopeptidase [Candidatus Thorarchaeota archaeon]|nr:MAG: aminopeptidase [Candidatus Thorarchaeota archaeon]
MDSRIEHHARIIVEWSIEIKPGDMVTIATSPAGHDLAVAVTKEVAKAGGRPITMMLSEEIDKAKFDGASEEVLELFPKHQMAIVENSDAFVFIRSPVNTRALASVDPKKVMLERKTIREIVNLRLQKRWVLTVHPCLSLAQQANMSLEEYQDFVYRATLLDWKKESKNMYLIKEHLEKHKDIRFVGPETDLWASTEGRIWLASDAKHNLPSGEVFTAPVETAVEGKIYFDIPFLQQGRVLEGVRLTFEKGEVVDYSAEKEEGTLKEILETDEGARRLGEMAIGTNRGITQYTLNMLFDEKIGDTIHCALGNAYKDNNGTNESAVHVDMIKTMIEGEITAGDEVIYSKGKFFYENE